MIMGCVMLAGCKEKPDHGPLVQEVKSANKMVFAQMSVTKTAKTERSDWYKLGKRIAVYSYDSYLRAYVDLSRLGEEDIVFDDDNKTVKVLLPAIETEIVGRDMELRPEYENVGTFRSNIDSKERADLKEKANASFRKEVDSNPAFRAKLIESAKRKARAYFETFFATNGYVATVDFRS